MPELSKESEKLNITNDRAVHPERFNELASHNEMKVVASIVEVTYPISSRVPNSDLVEGGEKFLIADVIMEGNEDEYY